MAKRTYYACHEGTCEEVKYETFWVLALAHPDCRVEESSGRNTIYLEYREEEA